VQGRRLDDDGAGLAAQLEGLLLARDLEHSGINLKRLSIIRNEACWLLYIDCVVLARGGCLLMALSAGIHKALQDTTLPQVSVDNSIEDARAEDIELDANPLASLWLDVTQLPVVVSACQVRFRKFRKVPRALPFGSFARSVRAAAYLHTSLRMGMFHLSFTKHGQVSMVRPFHMFHAFTLAPAMLYLFRTDR
jgi:hypothetical protein